MRDFDAMEGTLLELAGPIAMACRQLARTTPSGSYEYAVTVRPDGTVEGFHKLPIALDGLPHLFAPELTVLVFDADLRASSTVIAEQVRAWAAHERARPRCRDCGCTDEEGCAEGCWWVERDLCSSCVTENGEAP